MLHIVIYLLGARYSGLSTNILELCFRIISLETVWSFWCLLSWFVKQVWSKAHSGANYTPYWEKTFLSALPHVPWSTSFSSRAVENRHCVSNSNCELVLCLFSPSCLWESPHVHYKYAAGYSRETPGGFPGSSPQPSPLWPCVRWTPAASVSRTPGSVSSTQNVPGSSWAPRPAL